ncbi:MAG: hypothetical protein LBK26_02615 [Rickettsiales bacterium]|jgi:hypothetical protein|nr:hypothetical protein [Rickettsiales bacterium]
MTQNVVGKVIKFNGVWKNSIDAGFSASYNLDIGLAIHLLGLEGASYVPYNIGDELQVEQVTKWDKREETDVTYLYIISKACTK